jgi:hypothetical protein
MSAHSITLFPDQAREFLLSVVAEGSTVYYVSRHVSRSGQRRLIAAYVIDRGEMRSITGAVSMAAGIEADRDADALIVRPGWGHYPDAGAYLTATLSRLLGRTDLQGRWL